MRKAACAALAIAAALLTASPALPECHVRGSDRVVLYGGGDDPGVFLWDSRFRLRAYHLATFDEAEALLPRALLVRPGTRAIVIGCLRDFVQARYGLGFEDAVNVRILSGPLHGRVGWISASDMRRMP